jgi:hypothetical protein
MTLSLTSVLTSGEASFVADIVEYKETATLVDRIAIINILLSFLIACPPNYYLFKDILIIVINLIIVS